MFSKLFDSKQVSEGSWKSRVHVNQWDQIECSGCRGLSRLFDQAKAHRRRHGSTSFSTSRCLLHQSFQELDSCASDGGCIACGVFRRALLFAQTTTDAHDELVNGHAAGAISVAMRSCDDLSWLELYLGAAGVSTAVVTLSHSNTPRKYPSIQSVEPLSAHRVARLKSWLSECHQEHFCGNFAYSRRNPTWLIHILDKGQLQLVSGLEAGGNDGHLVAYVALSYC